MALKAVSTSFSTGPGGCPPSMRLWGPEGKTHGVTLAASYLQSHTGKHGTTHSQTTALKPPLPQANLERWRLRRTQVQFPAPTWQLTTTCNSTSRGSNALFWLPHALHAHSAQISMQHKTSMCTHATNNKTFLYHIRGAAQRQSLCLACTGPHHSCQAKANTVPGAGEVARWLKHLLLFQRTEFDSQHPHQAAHSHL